MLSWSSRYSYSIRTCLLCTYPFCTYEFRPKNSIANVPHYICTCDLCVCVYVCKMMISVYVWCVCVYVLVLHMLYGTAAWIPEKLPFSLYKYSYMNIYKLTHNVYRWNTKKRPGTWVADGPRAFLTLMMYSGGIWRRQRTGVANGTGTSLSSRHGNHIIFNTHDMYRWNTRETGSLSCRWSQSMSI